MIYLCHCEEPTGDVAIRIPCGAKHRPSPVGDGKRTDCQKVNCPQGKRGHPGVRAYALAMTW